MQSRPFSNLAGTATPNATSRSHGLLLAHELWVPSEYPLRRWPSRGAAWCCQKSCPDGASTTSGPPSSTSAVEKLRQCKGMCGQREKEKKQAKSGVGEEFHQAAGENPPTGRTTCAHERAGHGGSPKRPGAAYNVMRVYFERVVRGFDPIRYPEQTDATLQFFNAAFVKKLKTNDFTGREKYLEQWQLVNECHANVGCKATSIDVYPITDECLGVGGGELKRHVNAVKSCGVTTLQISRTTIERIFPHILSDEPLVQSLIGKRYSFTFTLIAYVDECDGRIFQTESTIDLTSALLDMLQDPFVTIKMVDAAAMTKRGNLLLMDDVHEDQNVIENGFL